jgi:hypothetical protein
MLGNESTAATATSAINAASLSAGANNGGWIDTRNYQGDLLFTVLLGSVTGSVIVKIQDATDGSGTGSADVSGFATASLNTPNSATKLIMPSSKSRGWVRAVATVTTGPILTAVAMHARPSTTA